MFAAPRVPGRDRRAGRRVDVLRRLAVPQLGRHRALPGLPVRRGRAVRRRALSDRGEPRPPRADRQVVGRLRRDGRADAAPGRLRRARLARRRRAVRVLLPGRRSATSPASCATTSTAPTTSSSSACAAADHFDWDKLGKPLEVYGYAAAYSPDLEQPGQGAAAVRRRDRPPARRRVGAVARQGPGADGAAVRRRAALDAPHLPRRRQSDEYYLDLGAQAFAAELDRLGVDAHARALRRQARRADLPLPGAIRELVLALALP